VALLLLLAARGLWRGRRWARSPVIRWPILLAILAIGWLGADPTVWAAVVLAVAVLITVGLLLPSTVAATARRQDPPA
jgi:hypothetical protein